jgi:hypothetical protein
MDVLDKFLKLYSYKFDKGYPDMNNEQDILLLESILKEKFDIILENVELENFLINSGLFKNYGDLEIKGNSIKFTDIPPRGSNSDSLRNEVYDLLQQLADKSEEITDYKRGKLGSSIGRAEFKFKGKKYLLPVKGTGKDSDTDTDVKEALVSMFYASNIDSPFTTENFESRIEQLIEDFSGGIPGETSTASAKVIKFLEAIQDKNDNKTIKFINQPLSSALAIKEVYQGQKIIRTGLFDEIRTKTKQLTGLPADKWCPGDLYVQLGSVDISNADNIEIINDLFVDEWGDDSKPLVAVSLKQEKAQGGKAKALLQKYTKVKDDYNLTKDEQNYTSEQYREGIKDLRSKVQSLIQGNDNITYEITSEELEDSKLKGKYAALKSIEFLFRIFPDQKVDDAVVALTGFALSLTGVNPTFFKLTGKSSGKPASVETFKRGSNVVLYNVEGEYEPIEILDTPGVAGLKLKFKIEKGGDIYNVLLNARNNGTTQGTLEIQNIDKVS